MEFVDMNYITNPIPFVFLIHLLFKTCNLNDNHPTKLNLLVNFELCVPANTTIILFEIAKPF